LYRGLYFGLYDSLKPLFPSKSYFASFLFAQGVTITAGILTYPLDTIRRRQMMQQGSDQTKYSGSLDCTIQIVRDEGVSALFAGALSNTLRTFLATIVLVFYDEMTR
jgi:solute carrier family 25 (adenine nucleotide translocator) protein 4/5/6/31